MTARERGRSAGLAGAVRSDTMLEVTETQVGPYLLEARLGVGGMGAVYRARDPRLDRAVVLKQIRTEIAQDNTVRRRFRREARLAARLNHPHIVKVHDLLSSATGDWIVMEWIEGRTLADVLVRGPLQLDQILRLADDIVWALEAAHAENIIHRDLKATNILVTSEFAAKVLDFGIAKLGIEGTESGSISLAGQLLGTPHAMSPEQALGRRVDPRSDLFAFGSLLYQMVAGTLPFGEADLMATIDKICTYHPPALQEVNPCVPEGLSKLVGQLLEKEPKHRPQTATEVRRRLRQVASERMAGGESVESPSSHGFAIAVEKAPRTLSSDLPGERRQVTILYCDLVDRAGAALAPETLAPMATSFEELFQTEVERLGGFVVSQGGHRQVAYFGYPLAHEGDAQRAVLAALEMVESFRELAAGGDLALRCGVHTGVAVVLPSSRGAGQIAAGPTLDHALRAHRRAGPNDVVVSHTTGLLLNDELTKISLESTEDAAPVGGYLRVVGQEPAIGHWLSRVTLMPLVGREQEMKILLDRWHRAQDGSGQVVLVSGEAGIGKSRLLRELSGCLSEQKCRCLMVNTSAYAQHVPLRPFQDLLNQALDLPTDQGPAVQRARLEARLEGLGLSEQTTIVALFCVLLELPYEAQRELLGLSPEAQRRRTFDAIVKLVLRIACEKPLLIVVEDLHWIDPSSLELLRQLAENTPAAPLLLTLTFRAGFDLEWAQRVELTQLSLSRLGSFDAEALVGKVTGGKPLPQDVLQQILDKTDGIPLFVEEMTKNVIESEALVEKTNVYELDVASADLSIPATLRDSLTERLDRLGEAKIIAQQAAVLGREFSHQILVAISSVEASLLERSLQRLIDAGLLLRRGFSAKRRYSFKHALVQDAAYRSLLRQHRRQFHARIGRIIESKFPQIVAAQPELLAHHFTEAGVPQTAVLYRSRAGQRAAGRYAHQEAIGQLTQGLGLVDQLPPGTDRDERELELTVTLGVELWVTQGGSEAVDKIYARARELCDLSSGNLRHLQVLIGLCSLHIHRANYREALSIGKDLLHYAEKLQDPIFVQKAHKLIAVAHLFQGNLSLALDSFSLAAAQDLAESSELLDEHAPEDTEVAALGLSGLALWLAGQPDEASEAGRRSLQRAEQIRHMPSLAFALYYSTVIHLQRHEITCAFEKTRRLLVFCRQRSHYIVKLCNFVRGWLQVHGFEMEDQAPNDEAQRIATGFRWMEESLAERLKTGPVVGITFDFTRLIESQMQSGRIEEARSTLQQAMRVVESTGERVCEVELRRLQGELAVHSGDASGAAEAEEVVCSAMHLARRQGAKSFELRAVMSLARLKPFDAEAPRAVTWLRNLYDSFTEGFETGDLVAASRLLQEREQQLDLD